MLSITQLQQQLPLNSEQGLPAEGVAQSRQTFGRNVLTPLPKEPLWRKLLEKFDEPIIKILLAAALLSMLIDLFPTKQVAARDPYYLLRGLAVCAVFVGLGWVQFTGRSGWLPSAMFAAACALVPVGVLALGHVAWDGLAVMLAVVLATGVAFLSEYKSDREFEMLNSQKDALSVKVHRAGSLQTLPLEEIVVGDLVVLEVGDEVPADGRVLKANELHLDQSLMTGEVEPIRKLPARADDASDGPEQPTCLYRGTQVVEGLGEMLVTAVGDATYLGQIARKLSDHPEDEASPADPQTRILKKLTISKEATPLQEKLTHLAALISKVGYIAAIAIFFALFARGCWVGELRLLPRADGETFFGLVLTSARYLLDYFMYMVIIIVVAVPEGLPMSVTVSLALAMRKMTRANSLVRQLVACETIGSATVICSDKTGTLTQNKMQAVRLFWDGQNFERGTPSWPTVESKQPWPRAGLPLDSLVLNMALNSTANLEWKEGKLYPIGNSTEGSLLLWLHESGLEYQQLRLQFPAVYQIHFTSDRKRMTTVVKLGDKLCVLVKGAPEWLLENAQQCLAADGTARAWREGEKELVQAQIRTAADQAMRTLAFGMVMLPAGTSADEESLHALRDRLEQGLIFVGFVGIRDPLRDDVQAAVRHCREAGIGVKMVTGDSVETARAIGREIGLLDQPDALVLTSPEFNALSDEALSAQLPRLKILARARPLDKLRLVQLLQKQNEVVAVTGDGTNDAPALKRADVGLAMGKSGTEVAKEASKIVLLDDAFSTIVKAVHWGRALYENIQRFIQFQLTINVSALVIAFLGPFFGVKPPFTILQLLWINVIMDTFAAIALCSEPPRSGLLKLPPKKRDENILTRSMILTILTTASFFVVVMMILLLGMAGRPAENVRGWWAGTGAWSEDFPELTVRQVSLFFTLYVMFQVWNEINCRSLVPEVSGLPGLLRNKTFLTILGVIVLGQWIIVTFGGAIFHVEPLGWLDWFWITVSSASVLGFAEIVRKVRLYLAAN